MAGTPLRSLVKSKSKMPSGALLAKLAQLGATSMAAKTPETGEKEVTSRAKEIEVVAVDSELAAETTDLVVKTRDRKRHRKDTEIQSHHHHHKKSKDSVAPPVIGSSSLAGRSYQSEMAKLRVHLDQVSYTS